MTRLTLLDSSKLRNVTGAMMYFARGIPRGLLSTLSTGSRGRVGHGGGTGAPGRSPLY